MSLSEHNINSILILLIIYTFNLFAITCFMRTISRFYGEFLRISSKWNIILHICFVWKNSQNSWRKSYWR